jgi:hypothetical protein
MGGKIDPEVEAIRREGHLQRDEILLALENVTRRLKKLTRRLDKLLRRRRR